MHRVYLVDSSEVPHAPEALLEQEVLEGCATVELLLLKHEHELAPYAESASALILWHHLALTRALIPKLKNTAIIVRNGVGYDTVDIEAAAQCGIPVSNVPDYGTEEVADHAITLSLALVRQLRPLTEDIARGNWRYQAGEECLRIRGKTFGIIGCGRIGTAVALRAKAFGFHVVFYDPYLPSGYEKAIGVGREAALEALLVSADVVSIHAPLTAETRHMIDAPRLRLMKKTAYLVNTARGPIVEHAAVEQALGEGWIAGAGLDVLEDEPNCLDLYTRFPNCLVTPHSAFYSQESMIEMRRSSAGIVRDALVHGRYRNVVNGVRPGTRA